MQLQPTVVSFTAALRALSGARVWRRALQLWQRMGQQGLEHDAPSEKAVVPIGEELILPCCCSVGNEGMTLINHPTGGFLVVSFEDVFFFFF